MHLLYNKYLHIILLLVFLLPSLAFAEQHTVYAEADRPGAGTGANVLEFAQIQWETGFEVTHLRGMHIIALPTSLFRFGLGPAELRLEYTGSLSIDDKQAESPMSDLTYVPDPLFIGSKIRLWSGSDEPKLKWIPRTSLLLNLGLPITKNMAKYNPITGLVDFLFENDLTEWLNISYDVGVHWIDWAPTPDIAASLSFNFSPTDKLGLFVESYNIFDPDAFEPENPNKYYTVYDINLDFGLTYMVHPHVQLDTYAGFNLYHTESKLSTPKNNVFFGLGVTWLLHH